MSHTFDHTQYKDEVEQRWGAGAYAAGDQWWRSLGTDGQDAFRATIEQLNSDWIAAADRGDDPTSESAQEVAQRHVEWLSSTPGTPAYHAGSEKDGTLASYLRGLGELYVADERFAANYGGNEVASFVRDALTHYADTQLG